LRRRKDRRHSSQQSITVLYELEGLLGLHRFENDLSFQLFLLLL